MKALIKKVLQFLLGYQNYLFIFSLFTICILRWKKDEGDFMRLLDILPQGGFILDVGANIGIMTVHLGRRFPDSIIYAYEPDPQNIKALKRIIRFFRLQNVMVVETALANYSGEARMRRPVIQSVRMQGLTHIITDDNGSPATEEGEEFVVSIQKLDSFAHFFTDSAKVTGIKIDVENFEFFVLDGARKLISTHKPIIYCELWKNEKRDMAFSMMKELGYSAFILYQKQLIPFDPVIHVKDNFYFLPE
ncbi:MAG: FkbM family methyltransferase [Bacteroidales bacterium]|nr:FkbM family methyltransferase [Lentimicrobiaceae bacterium]MDD5694711.1 FkbM family methyltransferase [Bacteroidales bacterium]